MERKKVTILDLMQKKTSGEKITMLTAYDFPLATMIDGAGIDMVLIGDSVGNVVLGYDNTLPVTMDEMIHHAKAVKRGIKHAFLVGDMPFMSFNVSREDAIRNAGRFIKEAGCDAVKLEGGSLPVVEIAKAIVDAGIVVMGHLGLTPQTATMLGGFKVQGKDAGVAKKILTSAKRLEQAGCFSIVLECVPDKLAAMVTKSINIPTIGIGAGPECDGQVLVTNDMVGLFERFKPKFVKQYVNLSREITAAIGQYIKEVKDKKFPGPEHCFSIKEEEIKKIKDKH
ncbi:MAG: 3-methyl-2-oxobutanoate hydroxymethyltransferase [Candidatus Omnitrophota bacterium]